MSVKPKEYQRMSCLHKQCVGNPEIPSQELIPRVHTGSQCHSKEQEAELEPDTWVCSKPFSNTWLDLGAQLHG